MEGEMNMSSIASGSHGDGDTIPQDLEEDYFHPNFKDYRLKEQLNWNSKESSGERRWVFWSQQDPEIEPSLSLDIRRALEKLLDLGAFPDFGKTLVQFWAPVKTLEGRTRLTTQLQPFYLGHTRSKIEKEQLCEYRMKMCSSEYNNCFYADAQSREELLGLPGRVFLHQIPEFTPYVKYYLPKEYPQYDLALRCKIMGSWAVPVFKNSSQTCVGVLETASLKTMTDNGWKTGFALCDIFKESDLQYLDLGLHYLDGYQACEEGSRKNEETVEGPTHVLKELKTQLCSVCEINELPLAMAWVPCSGCKGLRRCQTWSGGVEFCAPGDGYHAPGDKFLKEILKFSTYSHLRKGLVVKRNRSSNMLYCSDISQLSLDDYPLVPCVRRCKLSGWFTICLECKDNKNDIYVLEFFLSARNKDKDIMTTLCDILGTIDKKFTTFRLASGKELGWRMSYDVIDFQNGQKIWSVKQIQASREISSDSHLPPSHLPSVQFSATSVNERPMQFSATSVNKRPRFQDANIVTIKGKNDLNSDPVSDLDPSSNSDSDSSFGQTSTRVANAGQGSKM